MALDQFTAQPGMPEHDPFEAVLERMAARDEDGDDREITEPKSDDPLDSESAERLWKKLQAWLIEEKSRQSHNRIQQAIDHDFYDHLQWRGEDIDELAERGQAPLVFNRTALAINWLYGSALRTKTDWHVKPREKDDEAAAPIKTKLMKFVSDVNYAVDARLRAYKDALKGGVGWIDHGLDTDPTAELLRIGYESWRFVWYDSKSREPTYKDARYVYREKWVDLDVALAMFPKRQDVLKASAVNDGVRGQRDLDDSEISTGLGGTSVPPGFEGYTGIADAWDTQASARERVLLTECWYKVPEARNVLRGPVFHGQDFDPANPLMRTAVEQGAVSVVYNVAMRVRLALWCDEGLLFEGPSPYKHNRFPLVPVWCYRRDRDGAPYGVIRGMRDAQEDYNKRASKALHILSTRGLLFEAGAFDDEEEAREEISRPDFFLGYRGGRKVEFIQAPEIAKGHLDLMNMDALHMESSSGVTNELLALQSNATSGRAIEKRQQQGQLTTTEPTENFRLAQKMSGEITLSMIEQFYTEPKVFRITGDEGKDEFVNVNQPTQAPDGSWDYMNDITKRQADFVIDEIDYRESARQAQAEVALDFIGKLPPEAALKMLDLAVELLDLPNKSEFVKRARMLAGVPDPDEAKTPEGQAAAVKAQQKADLIEKAEMEALMANVAKLKGEAAKALAGGDQAKATAIKTRMDAVNASLQAALQILSLPAITPAADTLLEGVGMGTALDPALGIQPQQMPMQPVAPQPAPMPQPQASIPPQ